MINEDFMQRVDLGAAVGVPSEMVKARRVAVVIAIGTSGVRRGEDEPL
jgi:hypothetical protein